jgi:hypothetical protein
MWPGCPDGRTDRFPGDGSTLTRPVSTLRRRDHTIGTGRHRGFVMTSGEYAYSPCRRPWAEGRAAATGTMRHRCGTVRCDAMRCDAMRCDAAIASETPPARASSRGEAACGALSRAARWRNPFRHARHPGRIPDSDRPPSLAVCPYASPPGAPIESGGGVLMTGVPAESVWTFIACAEPTRTHAAREVPWSVADVLSCLPKSLPLLRSKSVYTAGNPFPVACSHCLQSASHRLRNARAAAEKTAVFLGVEAERNILIALPPLQPERRLHEHRIAPAAGPRQSGIGARWGRIFPLARRSDCA